MLDVRNLSKLLDKYRIDLNYYEGYVVDTADPHRCSRVKVRVQGLTTKNGKDEAIPVEDLPWYTTLQGFGEGGNSGTNIPPLDSRVIVIFPTDDIYNGLVVSQVTSVAPSGVTEKRNNGNISVRDNSNLDSVFGRTSSSAELSNNNSNSGNAGLAPEQDSKIKSNKLSGDLTNPTTAVGAKEATAVEQPSIMKRVYKNADGTQTVKEGGTKAWRNNNEGNIRYGAYAKRKGAIGQDKDGFAIFPSEEAGRKAKEDLIFETNSYKDKNLEDAIYRYAPPNENNTKLYQKNVLASVGGQNKKMSEYTPDERSAILEAMRKQEGYKVGTISTVTS